MRKPTNRREFVSKWLLRMAFVVPALGVGALLGAQDYTEEPINYLKTPAADAVADLQKKIDAGEVQLKYDSKHGYLLSVLQALHVPVSSQMLVFSKPVFSGTAFRPRRPAPSTLTTACMSDGCRKAIMSRFPA